jgi:hypothetical protein
MPLPMTTRPACATASSTSTGQSAGSPIGVIPPYSIPVEVTASSCAANEIFRTPRCLRITPFTSARWVASTITAA